MFGEREVCLDAAVKTVDAFLPFLNSAAQKFHLLGKNVAAPCIALRLSRLFLCGCPPQLTSECISSKSFITLHAAPQGAEAAAIGGIPHTGLR